MMESQYEIFEPKKKAVKRPRISAMEKAMNLLAASGFSEKELGNRLIRSGYTPQESSNAVAECRRRHYLDDEIYASDLLENLRTRGKGRLAIFQEMRRRGIPDELICRTVGNAGDDDEFATALEVFKRKLATLSDERDIRKKREKLLRFMAGRGFTGGVVSRIFEQVTINETDTID